MLAGGRDRDDHVVDLRLLRYNDNIDIRKELCSEEVKCRASHPAVMQSAIKILIENVAVTAIFDTGSDVNVISTNLFRRISEVKRVPTLPVSNCKILGAIGMRSRSVKIQTQLEIKIGNVATQCTFLIVEALIVDCIFGLSFLQEKDAKIDFSSGVCELKINGIIVPVELLKSTDTHGKFCPGIQIKWISRIKDTGSGRSDHEINSDQREQMLIKVSEAAQLNTEQRSELFATLTKYVKVFQEKPGAIKGYEYRMNVMPHKTFCHSSYQVPWSKRTAVCNEIQKMLKWNIIEHSDSPYSSPLLAVDKPNGQVRLVLDAREINKIIIPVRTRPESIDELIQRYHGVKYFTSIDLRASYWQIPIAPESRKYTAFIHAGRSYQFKVLPFGLNISSGVFISALDTVLGPELLSKVSLFVDDILIATNMWEEHIQLLEQVLRKFLHAGVTANLSKSKFALEKIKFLGHIITSYGILPDSEKLSAIANFPVPRTKRQLKAFLGLASFYRRFVPNQVLNSEPLLRLLRKNVYWNWTPHCQSAFEAIKEALVHSNMLYHPDMSVEFCLFTDASSVGLGSCLFQIRNIEGQPTFCTIGFASRTLSPCERSYYTTELELLAILWSFRKFHYYLAGAHTKIYCDHKALSFLQSCKLLHARLARWSLALQEYSYEIVYISGKDNVVADALSRMPQGLGENIHPTEQTTDFNILLMKDDAHRQYCVDLGRNMAALQDNDPRWSLVKQKLLGQPSQKIKEHYRIENQVLFYRKSPTSERWCVCIPAEFEDKLIWYTHITWGHFGVIKCANKIGTYCYFPNIRRKVRNLIRTCIICQKAKPINVCRKGELHPILPDSPLQIVAIDVCGPFPTARGGAKFIVAFFDVFTKYLKIYVLKSPTSSSILKKLVDDYIPRVGKPQAILSDNATTFTSLTWKRCLAAVHIKQILVSKYHPEANPVERVFRELNRFIRTYCHNNHSAWANYIKYFEEIVNNLPHTATNHTPEELMFRRPEKNEWTEILPQITSEDIPFDEKIRQATISLHHQAQLRKKIFDRKLTKKRSFSIGDKVLIRSHVKSSRLSKRNKKWQLLYTGPFEIANIPHPGAYLLVHSGTLRVKGLYPHQDIKKYIE